MKILSCHLENFGSYKELDFRFSDKGLTLLHGPTGAGKSTLCDAIPWVLFGRTAKGGAVDEVLSWNSKEPTEGSVELHTKDGKYLQIFRTRGSNKDNDLCFFRGGDYLEKVERGKDLTDTQKLINNLLGLDYETYLAGAYFHEFSQTASFFTTTSKIRRAITEQLVDLSLAKNLQTKIIEDKRLLVKEADIVTTELLKNDRDILHTQKAAESAKLRSETFTEDQQKRQEWLDSKNKAWEADRKERLSAAEDQLTIQKLHLLGLRSMESVIAEKELTLKQQAKLAKEKCITCGAPSAHDYYEACSTAIHLLDKEMDDIEDGNLLIRSTVRELTKINNEVNPYKDQTVKQINTYDQDYVKYDSALDALVGNRAKLEASRDSLITALDDLELLSEVVTSFRGELIKNTVKSIESNTNSLMAEFFDSEFAVSFDVEAADKLEVTINKDGNECAYTQLSKGQRQLLKLCFGMSVMKTVSNHHGVDFDSIFLDESLDGLDDNFKLKALRMLESKSLEHSSVFLVEHNSEIKAMIANKIEVRLVNGWSEVNE